MAGRCGVDTMRGVCCPSGLTKHSSASQLVCNKTRTSRLHLWRRKTDRDRQRGKNSFYFMHSFFLFKFYFYSSTNIQRGVYSSIYPETYAIARITKGEKMAERLRPVSSTESHELEVWKGKSRWWRDSLEELEERLTDHSYDS